MMATQHLRRSLKKLSHQQPLNVLLLMFQKRSQQQQKTLVVLLLVKCQQNATAWLVKQKTS